MEKSPPCKRKQAPTEKRLARKVSRPSLAVLTRIERAFAHRLYLLSRAVPRTEDNFGGSGCSALVCEFHVLGHTGNAYTVTLAPRPQCTCPDALKGNVCKHRLFVLLRVLKCNQDNPVVWQKALVPSELQQLLGPLCQTPAGEGQQGSGNGLVLAGDDVLADTAVREAYARLSGAAAEECKAGPGGDGDGEGGGAKPDGAVRRPLEGAECPVCFEAFASGSSEEVTFCRTCGNNIHSDCFRRWKQAATRNAGTISCVLCRAQWKDGDSEFVHDKSEGDEDDLGHGFEREYLNLAQYSETHRHSPERDPREEASGFWHPPGRWRTSSARQRGANRGRRNWTGGRGDRER